MMKLDIQLFAYSQTILDNKKSTGLSPAAYYTVTAEPNNASRTATSINIKVNVKSALASSSSGLSTGPTMGLNAYFKFNGESRTLQLKATNSGWSGTAAHYATAEWTIPLAATETSLPNITFRVERTGKAAGTTNTSTGAWLKETACSNITGIAQGLTAPKITQIGYNEPWETGTRFYINVNQASNIYYQFNNTGNFEKIGDNITYCEKVVNNLSPNTTYTFKFQAKNPADETLVSKIESVTFTTSKDPYFISGPNDLTLSSGTTDAVLRFFNPWGRAITITPSPGTELTAQTIYGESAIFKLDHSKLYQTMPNATKGTIVYSYVITTASGSKINGSFSQTYATSEQTCKPSIDITKFKYSAEHQNNYSWYTGAGLINNHSTLNVWHENNLASPKNGAGISSIKFTFAGVTKDIGTSSVNYGTTYSYTAPTAGTITVTDTRNYSSTANVNIAFVKYEIPKAWISAARAGGYGESVSISVGGSPSLAGNSLTEYQWSPDFSTWYKCDEQGKATTSISSEESKVLYCAVKDKAGNWSDYSSMSATARVTVQKGQPLMFIDTGIQGVGIDCFPTEKGLSVDGNITSSGDVRGFINTTTKPLPSGDDSKEYWNTLKNGTYWYGDTVAVPNMPSSWGWIEKTGYETSGDFSVLFYTQSSGRVYRKSGNANEVSEWIGLAQTSDIPSTTSILQAVYPVGSIYLSANQIHPNTIFGFGTWERLQGGFLYAGYNDLDVTGATGSSRTGGTAITKEQMPPHTHGSKAINGWFRIRSCDTGGKTDSVIGWDESVVNHSTATWSGNHERFTTSSNTNPNYEEVKINATHEHSSVGNGQAHDHQVPHIDIVVWRRIA